MLFRRFVASSSTIKRSSWGVSGLRRWRWRHEVPCVNRQCVVCSFVWTFKEHHKVCSCRKSPDVYFQNNGVYHRRWINMSYCSASTPGQHQGRRSYRSLSITARPDQPTMSTESCPSKRRQGLRFQGHDAGNSRNHGYDNLFFYLLTSFELIQFNIVAL